MKKILVSGAGGFVGARVMSQLAGRYTLCAFPKGMLAAADKAAVEELVHREQPDVILHTAAISDTAYSEQHPEESYRANVELPCWMAKAAKETGAGLVAFSSDQVYAGLKEHGPFNEKMPLSPANVYGRHKWEAEQRVLDILPDAVLTVEIIPAVTLCEDCGQQYPTVQYGRTCPHCQSPHTHLVQGNEMLIKEVEAVEGDDAPNDTAL